MDVHDSVYQIGDTVTYKKPKQQFGIGVIISCFRLHSKPDQTRYVLELPKQRLIIRRPKYLKLISRTPIKK